MTKIQKTQEYRFSDYSIEKFTLENGLSVIAMEDHSSPVFAYHTWFHVGSRNERDGITGIAHLFEHLMFKETKNHKEGEFDRILEEQGGKINAATYVDWTFYRQSLPSPALSIITELEADRMQHMILSQQQLDSEREVVANERRYRVDNSPSGSMYEKLYANAFQNHAYHWPVIGWMKDIQSIGLQDCLDFYSTFYAPNNATVVVVGSFDTQELLSQIEKHYGDISSSQVPSYLGVQEPIQKEAREEKISLEIPTEKVLLGYKSPAGTHPDYLVLEIINSIFFDGRSAGLYKKLVHEKEICSQAGGWVNQTKDPGLHIFDCSMRKGHTSQEAIDLIEEEIQKLQKGNCKDEDLDRAKSKIETSFWNQFRTVDHKAQALGFHDLVSGNFTQAFEEMPKLLSITKDQVIEAAQKYLNPEQRTTIQALPRQKS
ncbi:MAG: insulinase family protein [Bdellovibrionales bacterium]|nr:insulinase family protein [Bdellovibrionales bacterium]